jgi:hypothetical protein
MVGVQQLLEVDDVLEAIGLDDNEQPPAGRELDGDSYWLEHGFAG